MRRTVGRALFILLICVGARTVATAQGGPPPPPPLPPVPVPQANPITEEKRALGKILFWDEQLSGDDTVACGTCHSNGRSGTDGRVGINPGPNVLFGDADDVRGSSRRATRRRHRQSRPGCDLRASTVQVTPRSANASIIAAYSPELFWDGRARRRSSTRKPAPSHRHRGRAREPGDRSDPELRGDGARQSTVVARRRQAREGSEPLGHATVVPPDLVPLIAAHRPTPSSSSGLRRPRDHRRADRDGDRHVRANAGSQSDALGPVRRGESRAR